MTERGPEPAQPEGAPATGASWAARMQDQPTEPPTQVGSPWSPPGAATGAGEAPRSGAGTTDDAPTAAIGALPSTRPTTRAERHARGRTPPGGPGHPGAGPPPGPGRRGLAWWALGALLLAAAAVFAIVFGDDLAGTSAAGSQDKAAAKSAVAASKSAAAASSAPALPSLGDSTSSPSDTGTPTDGVPTDTAAPTSAAPTDAGGDPLGIGVPMTAPACDGTWIIILGSAIDPATYADDVNALLGADPEAKYVLTQGQCSSLRQQTAEGNQIYAVYLGPYPDQQAACDIRNGIGGPVYVKKMDDTTPAEQTYTC